MLTLKVRSDSFRLKELIFILCSYVLGNRNPAQISLSIMGESGSHNQVSPGSQLALIMSTSESLGRAF